MIQISETKMKRFRIKIFLLNFQFFMLFLFSLGLGWMNVFFTKITFKYSRLSLDKSEGHWWLDQLTSWMPKFSDWNKCNQCEAHFLRFFLKMRYLFCLLFKVYWFNLLFLEDFATGSYSAGDTSIAPLEFWARLLPTKGYRIACSSPTISLFILPLVDILLQGLSFVTEKRYSIVLRIES